MARRSKAIEMLFNFLKTREVDFDNFSEKDLEITKNAVNEKECIIWINDHSTLKPVYINDFGKEFYGFDTNDLTKTGFELYEKFLHPDHFDDVHNTIAFFSRHPSLIHRMTYRVKDNKDHWKWTYSLAKALNFDKFGKPKNILSVVFDIESMVDGVLDRKLNGSVDQVAEDMKDRFAQLTKREVEILYLISSELTSQEIGSKLFIEPSTVDTHRKNIIRKLGVKSSLGLVRYSLSFS